MGTIASPWRYDATFNFARLLPGAFESRRFCYDDHPDFGWGPRLLAATLPACQSAAGPDRDADRAMQAGQATLGRAEDTRAAGPALSGCPHPGDPMPAFLSGPDPRPTPTPAS